MKKHLPIILTTIIGLALGIAIGRKTNQSAKLENQADTSSTRNNRSRSHTPNESNPRSFRHQMQRVTQLAEQVTVRHAYDTDDPSLELIGKTINKMSAADILPALEKIKSMNLIHEARQAIYHKLFKRWATLDGHAATEYAIAHAAELKNIWLPNLTMHIWAKNAPYAADEWFTQKKGTIAHDQSISFQDVILQSLAMSDFNMAFEKAKSAPALEQKRLLVTIGKIASNNDEHFESYSTYISSITDEKQRGALISSLITTLSSNARVEKAIQFVDSLPDENKKQWDSEISYIWAGTEPHKALAWQYSRQEAPENSASEFSKTLNQWARVDAPAANLWITNHPDLDQDTIRSYSVWTLMNNNSFPAAAQWVSNIQDSAKRTSSYHRIHERWKQVDPEGADQWLHSLPQEDQNIITPPPK